MTSFAGFTMNRIANYGALALLLALVALLSPSHAQAQGVTRVCTELIGANGSNNCTDVSAGNPFPVTGTFTYPGTAGVATGGTTTAGTMPYVNAYIVNGSSGGTSSTFGSAFPATGTAIGLTNGTNMVAWSATTNYGTAPAAIAVPAVNADVTNVVTQSNTPNITATDCSGTITAGGAAQNAFTAQTTLHGFTIMNIDSSAGSGEFLWISFTTTAAASTAASYGLPAPTTTAIGGSFSTPPGFGLNHALSVIAATTGHKFSCTWW